MKDGPEVAEGVKTACSATNGHMLDEHNGGSDNALPVGGTLLDADTAKAKGDSKAFSCSICNRKFGYKHVLQNHERTHTGEKPFECPECHKRFTRDHHLKTHMRLHTGEKPYQCQHCERHFVQVANLRRHLRVHTGERPYGCQLCESRFSDSNQLKAHMLIHRGEKPFQCVQCKGRFRRRHHLIHHKCPKDESNLGKPRRGRRPKAYEQLIDNEDNEDDPDELPLTDNEENLNHTSSSEADQPSPESTPDSGVDTINNNNHIEDSPSPLAMSNGLISNGRRKASRTIRILTPQQRELFLRDKVTMQTQAIDMSLSPSPIEVQPVTVIVPNRFLNSVEGVLDLSSSRSDSEIEVIEEDVDCRCLRNGVRTAPGCNNLLGMMQPLNHSDDSDESTDNRHHSMNGIDTTIPLAAQKVNGRHSDDSDESLNHLSLNGIGSDIAIPLAARKTNGHHSEDSNESSHYHYPMNGVEESAIPLATKKVNGHHSEDSNGSASLHFHHPLLNGNAKRNDDSTVPLISKTVLVNGHYGGGGTSNHHYQRKLTNGHNKHSRCEDGHSVVIPLKKVHVSSNRTNGHLHSHSDDSNDSSHRLNLHHHHLPVINGIKHLGEDDNSMAIPLTRKKTHVASTA